MHSAFGARFVHSRLLLRRAPPYGWYPRRSRKTTTTSLSARLLLQRHFFDVLKPPKFPTFFKKKKIFRDFIFIYLAKLCSHRNYVNGGSFFCVQRTSRRRARRQRCNTGLIFMLGDVRNARRKRTYKGMFLNDGLTVRGACTNNINNDVLNILM